MVRVDCCDSVAMPISLLFIESDKFSSGFGSEDLVVDRGRLGEVSSLAASSRALRFRELIERSFGARPFRRCGAGIIFAFVTCFILFARPLLEGPVTMTVNLRYTSNFERDQPEN